MPSLFLSSKNGRGTRAVSPCTLFAISGPARRLRAKESSSSSLEPAPYSQEPLAAEEDDVPASPLVSW